MSLLQNQTLLCQYPLRLSGGVVGFERSGVNRWERQLNRYVGQGALFAGNSIPAGYTHPYSWEWSMRPGGIACSAGAGGTGRVTVANLAGGLNAIATLSGTGAIVSVVGALLMYAVADLAGSGTLDTAELDALGALAATLSGSGTAEADAILAQALEAAANLAGSGALIGDLGAKAGVQVLLTGQGLASALAHGLGSMSAAVLPYTELSPQALASAVWNAEAARSNVTGSMGEKVNDAGSAANPWTEVLESGYSAADVLRLIAAAVAGKVSGADTDTITFRDLADTKDRIVATTDTHGNRSAITRDAT